MADTKITGLTAYTPPIDTDVLPIVDITTTTTKKITWASIKAALKTYFDSLTTTLTNKTLDSDIISGAGGTGAGTLGYDAADHAILIGNGVSNLPIHIYHWKSYTPSLTNITLGSGTLTAFYATVGKTVFYRIYLSFAADTSVSGDMTFTFPATGAANQLWRGNCIYLDNGTGYVTGVILNDGICRVDNVAGTYPVIATCTATVPFSWTTNDKLYIEGFYELT